MPVPRRIFSVQRGSHRERVKPSGPASRRSRGRCSRRLRRRGPRRCSASGDPAAAGSSPNAVVSAIGASISDRAPAGARSPVAQRNRQIGAIALPAVWTSELRARRYRRRRLSFGPPAQLDSSCRGTPSRPTTRLGAKPGRVDLGAGDFGAPASRPSRSSVGCCSPPRLAPLILAYIVARGHKISWAPGELTMVVGFTAFVLIRYNGIIDPPGHAARGDRGSPGRSATTSPWSPRWASPVAGIVRARTPKGRPRKTPGTVDARRRCRRRVLYVALPWE